MNDRFQVLQRQPRRISITLNFQVYQTLLSRSEEEGRSMSNLCAFLLEEALLHQNTLAPSASPPPYQRPNMMGNSRNS